MASAFLTQDLVRVALDDDPDSAIYILPRMNIGQKAEVQGASLGLDAAGKVTLNVGAGNIALMRVNFRRWEGPKFTLSNGKLAPIDAHHLAMLDPDDALVQKALKEINDRNKEAASPDPNGADSSTSTTDGATS